MKKYPLWTGAAVAAALLFAGSSQIWIQKTDAFQAAEGYVVSMPSVRLLGEPIETRLKLFDFHVSDSGITGQAEFAIRATGKSGELVVDVRLNKELGNWSVTEAQIRD